MDELQVECPIHLDAVPLNDILAFKCGHGFCVPCLDSLFSHRSGGVVCPTCRKPIKRRDAFPLFLAPFRSLSQTRPPSSPPPILLSRPGSPDATFDATLSDGESTASRNVTRLEEKLRKCIEEICSLRNQLRIARDRASSAEEARHRVEAMHANDLVAHSRLRDDNAALNLELDALKVELNGFHQTYLQLSGQRESLEKRCTKGEEHAARLTEQNDKLQEDLAKLKAELQKSLVAKNQALQEAREERERIKVFEGRCRAFKQQIELEKKKRKMIEHQNKRLMPEPPTNIEDESLVVIDPNQPDRLGENAHEFSWLDNACAVQGDRIDIEDDSDPDCDLDTSGGNDVLFPLPDIRDKERDEIEIVDDGERPLPTDGECPSRTLARFPSDWSLGSEAELSLGAGKKRKHNDSRPGGSKFFKVKQNTGPEKTGGHRKPAAILASSNSKALELPLPLSIDRRGHVQGAIALGSRRKLNSRN